MLISYIGFFIFIEWTYNRQTMAIWCFQALEGCKTTTIFFSGILNLVT
jgi:hypothetical protein